VGGGDKAREGSSTARDRFVAVISSRYYVAYGLCEGLHGISVVVVIGRRQTAVCRVVERREGDKKRKRRKRKGRGRGRGRGAGVVEY
jgi:hypothetical protein